MYGVRSMSKKGGFATRRLFTGQIPWSLRPLLSRREGLRWIAQGHFKRFVEQQPAAGLPLGGQAPSLTSAAFAAEVEAVQAAFRR